MEIAIVAGEGSLPIEIAKKLRAKGQTPLALVLRSDAEVLDGLADPVIRLPGPRLSFALKALQKYHVRKLILAGRVPKKWIYLPALLDPLLLKLLMRTRRDDHSLLAALVEEIEERGIEVVPYWQIIPDFLAPEGSFGMRPPSPNEMSDIDYATPVLKALLPFSFGQGLVVAERAIVAVEAIEGTDAMVERAGQLVHRGTLVKMMRVDQDPRYDLPTVGPRTLEGMSKAGLTCLAVEAARTIIIEAEEVIRLAEKYRIALWGISCQIKPASFAKDSAER
jgi:DUF1009 family protein